MSRVSQRVVNIRGEWNVEDNVSLTPKPPEAVVLGTVSSMIVDENVKRKGLIIINNSSGNVYLGFGVDAVLGRGAVLFPGGVFNMAEDDFYSGKIFGVSNVANSLVTVQEFS